MEAVFAVLAIPAVLLGLYVLSLRTARRRPGWEKLEGVSYAHRGLHGPGVPENSRKAFRYAAQKGYGIELDLHLMADGTVAVIHDSLLARTTGLPGRIEDFREQDLDTCFLEDTLETVPTFSQVLALCQNRVPLIVEIKPVGNNHRELTDKTVALLKGYKGPYCIESFDPRVLRHLKKHYPRILRGQLSENFLASKASIPLPVKFAMTLLLGNFLTVPDFIAYRFAHRKNLGVFISRRLWGAQGVAWTLTAKKEWETAQKEGYIPIFENFEP